MLSRAETAEASLKRLSAQVQQLSSELSESRRRATESEAQGVTLGERLRESEAKGTEAAEKLAASLASAEELKSQIRAKDSSLETVTTEFSNQVSFGLVQCMCRLLARSVGGGSGGAGSRAIILAGGQG